MPAEQEGREVGVVCHGASSDVGGSPPTRIFISYSSKDDRVATGICRTLEATGASCWIAPRDITPGAEWGEAIIQGINASGVMVVVFSSNSNQSKQVPREVERAVNRGVPVVLFRVENLVPTGSLEYFLSSNHWFDAFAGRVEEHLAELSRTLTRLSAAEGLDGGPVHLGPVPPVEESRAVVEIVPDDWAVVAQPGRSAWLRRLFQDR